MSHLVSIPVQVLQPEGIRRACSRLGLEAPVQGQQQFYDGQSKQGIVVKLPDWLYPIVIDPITGEVYHDNFNGAWGEQAKLDQFLQTYAVETAKMTAEAQGYQVSEQLLEDGSVHLQVLVTH